MIAALSQANVIHFASHYLPNPRFPIQAKLLLAANGSKPEVDDEQDCLTVCDIYKLSIPQAKLLVLSACQTKADRYSRSEGAFGIARAFESLGVPLIVASLWNIPSTATLPLMTRLHEQRRCRHSNTAHALQTAQLALLKGQDQQFQHPYYWAGFAVLGGYSQF